MGAEVGRLQAKNGDSAGSHQKLGRGSGEEESQGEPVAADSLVLTFKL